MGRITWWQGGVAAIGMVLFAGCGAPGSAISRLTDSAGTSPVKQTAVIAPKNRSEASSQITVRYGRPYVLSVPKPVRHQTIGLADTPKGVVLLLPPGWTTTERADTWMLAMAKPDAQASDLLQGGGRVLTTLTVARGRVLQLTAITDGYALLLESDASSSPGESVLWSVNLRTGATGRLHQWQSDQVDGLPFVSGRGVVAWWDPGTDHGTAVDLSTLHSVTIPQIYSADALGWEDGSLWANGASVELPFLKPYVHVLPKDYQWVGSEVRMAVPDSWVVSPTTGNVTVAHAPGSGTVRAVVTTSHCVGCYVAAQISNRVNAVAGPDSPELSLPSGTRLFWLSDHAIAYTLPQTTPGYQTYGVTVTEPQGGEVRAEVTVPVRQMHTATIILNSLWWP